MFDNKNDIHLFNYEVQLEQIVKGICDISFDIGNEIVEIIDIKDREKGFTIADLFNDDFLKEISIRPEVLSDQENNGDVISVGYTNDEFFSYISDYFNQTLFNNPIFLTGLNDSNILLINKKQTFFLGLGENAKDRLIPALKKAKILKQLISNLKSEKIQNSLQKIDMFENDIFYRNTIRCTKQESQPFLPYLDISFINQELIISEEVDIDDYWINSDYYAKIGANLGESEQYLLFYDKETKKEIGLAINNAILLFANVDLAIYINKEKIKDFYWLLIEKTYTETKRKNIITNVEDSIATFKALINDVELNQLLSFLKNNFYINEGSIIKEKFLKFFNQVVLLDKLDFLDDYQFLMSPNIEEETALGVYSNVKKEKSYNLLHWLNHKGTDKLNHFRSPIPTSKNKKTIYTLKPAICYYFLEKYFEDFFEDILNKNGYTFFANKTFFEKSNVFCEIDFFVSTNSKFFYFETKTKLSKFYIEDFLKKSSKMIDKFKPMIDSGIEIEFILVGGYSDENVKDYQYFINESTKVEQGYNIYRENLNCKPYYFNVPIPDKHGKQITCIAEPEYEKLQTLLLEICQK